MCVITSSVLLKSQRLPKMVELISILLGILTTAALFSLLAVGIGIALGGFFGR